MSSVSTTPSPQEIDSSNSNGDSVVDDPEAGTRTPEEDSQSQHELLIRHGSDASSSSSSSTSSSSNSSGEDNEVSGVVMLIGSTANLCSATLGAGM